MKVVFVMLANSADPDEMPPYAAFYLGLHCLSKYLFTKWLRVIKTLIKISLSDWAY